MVALAFLTNIDKMYQKSLNAYTKCPGLILSQKEKPCGTPISRKGLVKLKIPSHTRASTCLLACESLVGKSS
jgi:hypothetical protein